MLNRPLLSCGNVRAQGEIGTLVPLGDMTDHERQDRQNGSPKSLLKKKSAVVKSGDPPNEGREVSTHINTHTHITDLAD